MDMAAVQRLCTRGVYLDHGRIAHAGEMGDVIRQYLFESSQLAEAALTDRNDRQGTGLLRFIDASLRDAIFGRIREEHERTVRHCLSITQQSSLLEDNPTLERSIRNRFPYLDPLNHLQVELLRRYRAGETDVRTRRAIHLTINGIAAGLRNSG